MSFHNEIHVKKTRRARWCNWCSECINKGDPSVSTSGIFEGDFYRGRYHPECSTAITRYYAVNKCWGWMDYAVKDLLEELRARGEAILLAP